MNEVHLQSTDIGHSGILKLNYGTKALQYIEFLRLKLCLFGSPIKKKKKKHAMANVEY